MWDFGTEFDFIITSLSGNPLVKRKVVKDFLRTVHPDDLDDFTNELRLFSSSKNGRIVHRFRSDYLSVHYKWYELTGEVVADEDGTSLKAVGVIQDTNDRVNEHELIRENKKLLLRAKEKIEAAVTDRTIALKNLTTALVYVNKDYIVQWSSMETMKEVFGEHAYSEGVPCYQTTFGRDIPCKRCPVKKMFESKRTETMRIQMKGLLFLVCSAV
ncbi:hypothetical protein [Bacteroides sp. 51]|uniref:hypothetical protein n=1 Tax=Bacteroides sp. 51 TaxID=2302938 RepID=UPI00194039E8|nr:hypothetical protein [Bacteroides sp. 51]NDV81811.1 hypothetical protein [Bacteroides sp. 51]